MAQEAFLKQLWRVIRHSTPSVASDTDSIDARATEQRLSATDLWLTPKTVDEYQGSDFAAWPEVARNELSAAVEGFRQAASAVPSDRPAEPEQRATGAEWLARVLAAVRPVVRDDWVSAVESRVGEAETWCGANDWATRRMPNKVLVEPLLGRYEAPQLLIHLPERRLILTPVSRFVAGGTGLMDLYAMPALGGHSVVRREGGGWEFLPSARGQRARAWAEATFLSAVRQLARDAA